MMKMKNRLSLLVIATWVLFTITGCPAVESDPDLEKTAPTVISVFPIDSGIDIPINTVVTATLSEDMNSASINSTSFTLTTGLDTILGTVTYDVTNKIAIFTPSQDLTENTVYTATMTTEVKDLAGNALIENKVWSFTTSTAPDIIAPTVLSTVPVNYTIDIAMNSTITASFSESMTSTTIITANFTVKDGTTEVIGVVTYDSVNNKAIFTPSANLLDNKLYTATITTGVKDLAGNALAANKVWSFTTSAAVDVVAPVVNETFPVNQSIAISINSTVTAIFSEEMNSSTINDTNFILNEGTNPVSGAVTYDSLNNKAIFTPSVNLTNNTVYTATVTTGSKDLAGNAIATNKVWSFTTAEIGSGPAPVSLGSAVNYVILAKTAISTIPDSVITGDIGLSPAAESYMTGFSQTKATGYSTSLQVTGFMYASDMTPPTPTSMVTAISDMETAYTDAAGRVTPDFLNLESGNIGGLTLVPGLYKWTSAVTIPSDVTINGNANDVWIFQISGNLLVSASVKVLLTGGAQAKNIFWQIAGEASLDTGSHFEGIILSQTAISLNTGASINGILLAQTQVALDQATVTKPVQ
ncbi:MAG TPA: hypothetical protein DC057_19795 [Spirochaetia bacterium]|nr:hypothetical protein [Spirochaetia bacterium]